MRFNDILCNSICEKEKKILLAWNSEQEHLQQQNVENIEVARKCTFKKVSIFFSTLPFSFVFNSEVDYCKMYQYSTQSQMILINSGSAEENSNDFCETIQNLYSESDLICLNKCHLETLFTQFLLSTPNLSSNW